MSSRPGPEPVSKFGRVKLRYPDLELADWLEYIKMANKNALNHIFKIGSGPGIMFMRGTLGQDVISLHPGTLH